MIATLDSMAEQIILINTFHVDPDQAEELLSLLICATEQTMRHLPGFVSANLHISLDRRHIANYAQWQSKEHIEAMLQNQEAQLHMRKAATIAKGVEPILYELRRLETRDGLR